MKEPTDHYEAEYDDDYSSNVCAKDGDAWPCKTWKRWLASKDYRIAKLEESVMQLGRYRDSHEDQARKEREKFHQLELFVKGGLALQANDLARHGKAGLIETTYTQDYENVTAMGSHLVHRVKGLVEYHVRYNGVDGSVYEDGELVERTYSG